MGLVKAQNFYRTILNDNICRRQRCGIKVRCAPDTCANIAALTAAVQAQGKVVDAILKSQGDLVKTVDKLAKSVDKFQESVKGVTNWQLQQTSNFEELAAEALLGELVAVHGVDNVHYKARSGNKLSRTLFHEGYFLDDQRYTRPKGGWPPFHWARGFEVDGIM
jgi:hypothetical protein